MSVRMSITNPLPGHLVPYVQPNAVTAADMEDDLGETVAMRIRPPGDLDQRLVVVEGYQ